MSHCPGCGGHLGTSAHGYGHILGCGFDSEHFTQSHSPMTCVTPHGPWGMQDQHDVLLNALRNFRGQVGEKATVKDARAFAGLLKAALQKYNDGCPYPPYP